MNPQIQEPTRLWHELTDEERRKLEVKSQAAAEELEGMEHHIPPRKGEYCYFKSGYEAANMRSRRPRYVCETDLSGSIGVDFSVDKCLDTYYSCYHYQGRLKSVKVDHGPNAKWKYVHFR